VFRFSFFSLNKWNDTTRDCVGRFGARTMCEESDDNFAIRAGAQSARVARNVIFCLRGTNDDRAARWGSSTFGRAKWNDDSNG
jgi:hypothetical protein